MTDWHDDIIARFNNAPQSEPYKPYSPEAQAVWKEYESRMREHCDWLNSVVGGDGARHSCSHTTPGIIYRYKLSSFPVTVYDAIGFGLELLESGDEIRVREIFDREYGVRHERVEFFV